MLTCFDANFDEVWAGGGAEGGGDRLLAQRLRRRHAPERLRHDPQLLCCGRRPGQHDRHLRQDHRERGETPPQQFIATLDLDLTIIHTDFNGEKVARLLREHKGEVEPVPGIGDMESWFVLRAVKPGVRVRDLCKQYQIETLREYRHRSREQINEARKTGKMF